MEKEFVNYLSKLEELGSLQKILAKSVQQQATAHQDSNWLMDKKAQHQKAEPLLAQQYYQQLLSETGRSSFYPMSSMFPKE